MGASEATIHIHTFYRPKSAKQTHLLFFSTGRNGRPYHGAQIGTVISWFRVYKVAVDPMSCVIGRVFPSQIPLYKRLGSLTGRT